MGASAGVCALVLGIGSSARAWELQLEAPAACVTPERLRARIDGQRTGADPAVALAIGLEGAAGAWRARVDVSEAGVAQGRREVAGTSCAETVAAVALIGAMALDRAGGPLGPASAPAVVAAVAPEPAPEPAPPDDTVTTLGGRRLVLREPGPPQPELQVRHGLDFTLRFLGGVDTFGLPAPSPGLRAEIDAGRGAARIVFGAAWSAEAEDVDEDGTGLAIGASRLDVRARARLGHGFALGVGAELGRLSARGIGVDLTLARASSWWAVVGEGTWQIPVSDAFELFVGVEVARPVSPRVFVVDDQERFRTGTTLRIHGGAGFLFH